MKSTIAKLFLVAFAFTLVFTSCFKDDLLKEIDELKETVSSMQRRNDSLSFFINAKADSLGKALTAAQKRSDSLASLLKTKSDSLSIALGITNTNLATLTRSVDSIKVQVGNINGQLTQLNNQLISITSQLTQLNQQFGALGADYAALNTKYQELSATLQGLNTQIAALQAEQLKLLERLNAIMLQLNPPVDITTGLVAYYPFSGNAGDSSGNENHGTAFGITYTLDRFNNQNSAASFNGIDNYVRSLKSGPIGNPQVTVSFWIKTNSQKSGHIVSWGDNLKTGNDFRIIINGNCLNAVSFDTYNSAVNYSIGSFTNQWDHYLMIYDGTIAPNVFSSRFYKNGSAISNTCFTQNFGITNILGTNPITIGKYHGQASSEFLLANLDDIRIYNRALTQSQITYLATH